MCLALGIKMGESGHFFFAYLEGAGKHCERGSFPALSVIDRQLNAYYRYIRLIFKQQSMTIQVKFFASLRETLNLSHIQLESSESLDAHAVWVQATDNTPMPENTLCAVNLSHVELEHLVRDGDEVAFFPPVTGG